MTKIKVIIATQNGDVLDSFFAEPHKNPDANEIELSRELRDVLEHRFNISDDE